MGNKQSEWENTPLEFVVFGGWILLCSFLSGRYLFEGEAFEWWMLIPSLMSGAFCGTVVACLAMYIYPPIKKVIVWCRKKIHSMIPQRQTLDKSTISMEKKKNNFCKILYAILLGCAIVSYVATHRYVRVSDIRVFDQLKGEYIILSRDVYEAKSLRTISVDKVEK